MTLRLIEVSVEADRVPDLRELLAEREVDIHSETEAPDERHIVRLVVSVEQTEPLTDALTDAFGASEAYRVLILDIAAVLPASENNEDEDDEGEGEEPPPARVSREELYQDVSSASRLTPVFLATVALSTIVAAAGLVRGDVAVIIGAMVIAPLLGPTVAFALGLTLGDPPLGRLAAKSSAAGIAVAFGLSVLIGILVPVDPTVTELANRTQVGLSDIAIALAAGSAGSLAYTTGLPTAIIGVMVAVALLPPLVGAGLLFGAGYAGLAIGSTVLVLVNFTCVSLAAVGTFFARRVRPRTWWESEKAKKATRLAVISWLIMLGVLVGLILLINREEGRLAEIVRPPAEEAASN
ncbi:MAG TPA: TIGR00341 family protein [Gemmatimonadota bacterium]|nr:TIGR00341 family protein [Gemmatimonadota bacterium]